MGVPEVTNLNIVAHNDVPGQLYGGTTPLSNTYNLIYVLYPAHPYSPDIGDIQVSLLYRWRYESFMYSEHLPTRRAHCGTLAAAVSGRGHDRRPARIP